MRFSLIGYPLSHSVSPYIHQQLFKYNSINATYVNTEISPDDLNLRSFMTEYDGINVTIPHKTSVISSLDKLVDEAEYLNTVNTIKKIDNKLYGYNTDAYGFLTSLKMADISLKGNVLLCGAGGTARMICCLAAKFGCNVTISSRKNSIDKAQKLANDVNNQFNSNVIVKSQDEINDNFDLLINATPAGMYPKNIDITPVEKSVIKNCNAVFDAVYNPKDTLLIKTAKMNGAKVAYGMPMLVYQAAKSQNIWFGAEFDDDFLQALINNTNEYITNQF